jgi:hypothetical protein
MNTRFATLVLLAPLTLAQDAYRTLPLDQVTWTGEVPDLNQVLGTWDLRQWPQLDARADARETWLALPYWRAWRGLDRRLGDLRLSLKGTPGSRVTGELWVPEWEGVARFPFSVELGSEIGTKSRADFLESRFLAYAWRHAYGLPGAAWFRHQRDQAAKELLLLCRHVPAFADDPALGGRRGRADGLDDTYDLFTGGRALAENLALDDVLAVSDDGVPTVAIKDVPAVTVPEIDWTPLVEGLDPKLDPLASQLPADQHALFFPSFAALTRVLDEVRDNGAPVLELLDSSSEDAHTQARYERQLALSLDTATRLLGAELVSAVAVTGGDPYFRTGTDVAFLFASPRPAALMMAIAARQRAAVATHGARAVEGQVRGVAYQGALTTDRSVSTYMARLGDTVVVTNSLVQLEGLLAVAQGTRPALASLDEYRWFRDRYKVGEEEDALVVVSDATIRRWVSPRWRIGASRRTRAAAVLSDQVAAEIHLALEEGRAPVPGGVRSGEFGTPDFLTPIGELALEHVTSDEVAAYGRFRRRYSNLWREVFDPLAARLITRGGRLELDLSVRPLVVRSDYRELIGLTRGAKLAPQAGDPHPEAALHFAMAFGRESELYKDFAGSLLTVVFPKLADPLAWVGDDLAVWVDDDPALWEEAAQAEDLDDFLEENFWRVPIALRVPSRDPFRLAAFLVGMRAFIDGASPGLLRYETRTHSEQAYVALRSQELEDFVDQPVGLYYVALKDAWVVSLREDVLLAAIDRAQAEDVPEAGRPWLGESAALRLGPSLRPVLAAFAGERWREQRQQLAWRALPILDEWRRLFPDQDPVEFHRALFGVTLRSPDGGHYLYDGRWGGMACSVHGHPGEPLRGPLLPQALLDLQGVELGVTFEEGDGLRARVRLDR